MDEAQSRTPTAAPVLRRRRLAAAEAHYAAGDRDREVWWLHGARNAAEHAFAEEARTLLAGLPRARAHVCYSRPAPGDPPVDASTSVGRLSAGLLDQLGVPRQADVYLCGPPPWMTAVRAALRDARVPDKQIHCETFAW